jgi:phage-related protein
MPRTPLVLFRESDGTAPLLEWLDELPDKARDKCVARLARLSELGHELRRPEADLLRDDIYELRASFQGIHYRMLYFFHGKAAAVVSHGVIKERTVPAVEIDRAIRRRREFLAYPSRHTMEMEL